ncbi:Vps51/Vps67-domain-containing protein [Morchella snyderi]|nr:Vps51/Vps67-domain-containing protein [Morchella snyderi]
MTTPAITFDASHASPHLPSSSSRSSSRGVSLDLPLPSPGLRSPRRNRSALRQFYGLKASDGAGGEAEEAPKEPVEEVGELDREGFEASTYAEKLLETAELKELLRVENELVNEIRGFDGERKALVYDNYSKLIMATDTIRKMRANMEPLAPTTSTLGPAIAHIAQVSASLVQTIPVSPVALSSIEGREGSKRKKETVMWALGCPGRIEAAVKEGNMEEAEREWGVLKVCLEKWDGVKGVEQLRAKALKALGKDE